MQKYVEAIAKVHVIMEYDERTVCISITEQGDALKNQAIKVPESMSACVDIKPEEAQLLYEILNKLLERFEKSV